MYYCCNQLLNTTVIHAVQTAANAWNVQLTSLYRDKTGIFFVSGCIPVRSEIVRNCREETDYSHRLAGSGQPADSAQRAVTHAYETRGVPPYHG
jgi:hypothetical protein